MAVDIAELGIKIDSRDTIVANRVLQELAARGKDAEASAQNLVKALVTKAATLKMTAHEVEMYKIALAGANKEQLDLAAGAQFMIKAHEKAQERAKMYKQIGEDIGTWTKRGVAAATVAIGGLYLAWEHAVGVISDYKGAAEKAGIVDYSSLATLKTVMDMTGKSTDEFANNLNTMQRQLARGNDESKGAARALSTIGLSIEEIRKLDPVSQWKAIAKGMDGVAESGGKVALIQDIMGRGGAEQLAVMKKYIEVGDSSVKVTNDQIEAADNWKDAAAQSRSQLMQLIQVSSTLAIPTMTALKNAFMEVGLQLVGVSDKSDALSRNRAIQDFAEAAGAKVAWLADVVVGAVREITNIGKVLGSLGAAAGAFLSIDLTDQNSIAAGGRAIRQIWQDVNADIVKSREGKTISQTYKEQLDKIKSDVETAKKTTPKLDVSTYTTRDAKPDKAAIQAENEYQKLIKSIQEKIDAQNLEITMGRKLTAAEAEQSKVETDLNSTRSKLNEAQKESVRAKLAENIQTEKNLKQHNLELKSLMEIAHWREETNKEINDATVKSSEHFEQMEMAQASTLQSIKDQSEILDKEASLIGATNTQRQQALAIQKAMMEYTREEDDISHDLSLSVVARAAAIQKAAEIRDKQIELANKDAAVSQARESFDTIGGYAKDLWDIVWSDGRDAFKKVGDYAKRAIGNALGSLFQRAITINIQSMLGGGAGAGGAAGAIAGAGSSISGISGLSSLAGLVGGGSFTGGLAAGAGWLTGTTSIGSAVGAGGALVAGGEVAAGIGMIAGALGPIALGVYALYSLFSGKRGGPKQGGAFGPNVSIGHTDTQNDQLTQQANASLKNMDSVFQSVSRALGGNGAGVQFGMGLSTDPQGTAPSFVEMSASRNGQRIAGNMNTNVGRTAEELTKAIASQSADVMIEALRQSGIDQQYFAYFDKISAGLEGDAKLAAFDTLIQMANLTNAIKDADNVFGAFASTTIDVKGRVADFAGGIQNLSAGLTAYMQMLPESARRQAQVNSITRTLNAAGINLTAAQVGIMDRVAFIQEVNDMQTRMAANPADEAAQKAFAGLMSVASTFASITENADESQRHIVTLTEAQDALNSAYTDQLKVLQDAKAGWDTLAKSMRSAQNNLKLNANLSILSPQQRYEEAVQQFNVTKQAALAGDEKAQQQLEGAGNTLLEMSRSFFSSGSQYQNDFARVMDAFQAVEGYATGRVSVMDDQIQLLNEQVNGLTDIKDEVHNVYDAIVTLQRVKAGDVVVQGTPLAVGMARVPFDKFPALLHADEAVLSRPQADTWRAMPDMISELRALRSEVANLRTQSRAGTGAQLEALYDATARAANRQAEASIEAARRTVYARKTIPLLQ
jgi:hypothetical protein